jgi:hypothetical protein
MPIDYSIDHSRRLVIAKGSGVFTDDDVFGYQRSVWSRPDVAGYDELVDMTDVTEIALPSPNRVRDLADEAAAMDRATGGGKFAIVAPQDVAYGLGRMYEANRELTGKSTKQVAVFRTMPEALAFLGLPSGAAGS